MTKLHPLDESRPLAVWVYTAVLACACIQIFLRTLPLARGGEVNMYGVILTSICGIAGIEGFFIKRLWGIAMFVAGEVLALSQVFGVTTTNVAISVALLVPMLAVCLNYRSQFRIW